MKRKPLPKAKKRKKTPPESGKRNGGPVRWTITRAAIECGLQPTQLKAKRVAADIHPGTDHKFSTRQILAMIYGDKAQADARRAVADAAAAVRRDQREAGELLPTATAKHAFDPIGIILRQKICASSMTENEKDEMLADIERGILAIDWEKLAKEGR